MSAAAQARRDLREARFTALLARVRDMLASHGYEGDVTPGTFQHVRNCERCGRRFEVASTSWDGSQGLWVFWSEEDRRWRIELRRENDRHHRFDFRDGEHCPVLAFALAQLPSPLEQPCEYQ